MWFLQADIFLRLLIACAAFAVLGWILRRSGRQAKLSPWLIAADLALFWYVSRRLAVFYALYALITCGFIAFLEAYKGRGRKYLFAALCFGCAVPVFIARFWEAFPQYPALVAMVGISYTMLKAVDGLYYTYYTGEHVPLVKYANYLLFFPVITAGPIMRYRDFARSYDAPQPVTAEVSVACAKRMILGLFKKVVAYELVILVFRRLLEFESVFYVSFAVAAVSWLLLWLDMSGYADVAIALGGLLGYTVPENFKTPLKAGSMTQYWRNWHVTLGDWIREHVFIIVSGRRLSKWAGAAIGFGSMLFMGLWHGFHWIYVIYGCLNGILIAFENLAGLTTVSRRAKKPYKIFRCAVANFIFAINTLFFTLTPEQLVAVLRGFLKV